MCLWRAIFFFNLNVKLSYIKKRFSTYTSYIPGYYTNLYKMIINIFYRQQGIKRSRLCTLVFWFCIPYPEIWGASSPTVVRSKSTNVVNSVCKSHSERSACPCRSTNFLLQATPQYRSLFTNSTLTPNCVRCTDMEGIKLMLRVHAFLHFGWFETARKGRIKSWGIESLDVKNPIALAMFRIYGS